jgi:hypothetical protein
VAPHHGKVTRLHVGTFPGGPTGRNILGPRGVRNDRAWQAIGCSAEPRALLCRAPGRFQSEFGWEKEPE